MRLSRFIVVAASVIVTACTHPALSRFKSEYGCPSATIVGLGASAYQVEGCGRRATYVCAPHGIANAICAEERLEQYRASRGRRAADAELDRPTRLRLQEGQVAGSLAVRLVIPQLGGALVYAPEVDRAHVIAQVPARAASRCEDVRVAADGTVRIARRRDPLGRGFAWDRESLDGIDRGALVAILFCGHRHDVVGSELVVLRRFIARARELAHRQSSGGEARAGSTSSSTLAAEPSATSTDAATRTWLDANRDVILGCASRETVVVRVEAGEGGATVSLQPPLAGGPEEACVRSALRDPPIVQGVVIHAVR